MKHGRKIICMAMALVLLLGISVGLVACKKKAEETPLSFYQGEQKDANGRTVYNTELFYSNQIKQGGPDPQVLDDTARSGYYYLYSTLPNFHTMRSENLVEWDDVGPTFFNTQSQEVKRATYKDNWAPEVIYDADMGKYLMFFSATPENDTSVVGGENGIVDARTDYAYSYNLYLAVSDSPEGPFIMLNFEDENSCGKGALHNVNTQGGKVLSSDDLEGKTWVEQDGVYYEAAFPHYFAKYCYLAPDKLSAAIAKIGWSTPDNRGEVTYYGCIDPSPFIDPQTGEKILYFKSEDRSWNVIMAVKMKNNNWLTPDWNTLTYVAVNGYYTVQDWENGVNYGIPYEHTTCNEGPFVVYHKDSQGNRRYYLSYSMNSYGQSDYQVGTAVSDSPMGPFRKLTEEEGGLLVCSTTTESQTISGAGHHSYIKTGGQEFIIYHRHIDYDVGGGARYTAVDEMKWLATTDINGNYLEVPYLNGPTDSLQPLPEKFSEYKNIAPLASVSCSEKGVNVSAVNDGFLSVHKTADDAFMEKIGEAEISGTTTFTFDFDTPQTVRAVMVYNAAQERNLFRNISKIELVLPDGSVRVMQNVAYDIGQYCDYVQEIDEITYSMSGSAAFAEFYDINVKSVKVTVEVPNGQSRVGISEIKILGKKDPQTVTENTQPYSFTNTEKFVAEADSDMTIDGRFDEARWNESRWLYATDRINSKQYAEISFTTSYGGKGIYFAMKVEEFGTNIYVNPDRASYINSSIEMYMAPANDPTASTRMFEFDFLADGSYKSKLNYNGWTEVRISGASMPVVKAVPIGGEVNTPACTGYQIEAFFPNGYLEFAGYDTEHLNDLVLGIDPVHIFSFDYEGKDLGQSRYWSCWSQKYLTGWQWQNPATFFHFGKDGLVAYDMSITIGGSGKGTVEDADGNTYLLPDSKPTLVFHTKNGSGVSKVVIDGEDVTNSIVRVDSETYTYTFTRAVTGDVVIEVDFD